MKKYLFAFGCVVVCFIALLITSCGEKAEEEKDMHFFGDMYFNDDVALEDALTKEYDLDELKNFFGEVHYNEEALRGEDVTILSLSEVHSRYPVEVIRTGRYSVYKVKQGGYFYVFWTRLVNYPTGIEVEPLVKFTTYIVSNNSVGLFRDIRVEGSTAEDVKNIDPHAEMIFSLSHAIYSYSYISDRRIMQIKYGVLGHLKDYDDLIVIEKKIIKRELSWFCYSKILSSDLP